MAERKRTQDSAFHGILVWSMFVPFCGVLIGFVIGHTLFPGLENLFMIVGFLCGGYLAVHFGRKSGAYTVFLFTIVGIILACSFTADISSGWELIVLGGAVIGTIAGITAVSRRSLVSKLKSIWNHDRAE